MTVRLSPYEANQLADVMNGVAEALGETSLTMLSMDIVTEDGDDIHIVFNEDEGFVAEMR